MVRVTVDTEVDPNHGHSSWGEKAQRRSDTATFNRKRKTPRLSSLSEEIDLLGPEERGYMVDLRQHTASQFREHREGAVVMTADPEMKHCLFPVGFCTVQGLATRIDRI